MLLAIMLAYGLFCMRMRIRLEASWAGALGSASLCVGTWGVYLRRDFVLTVHGFSIRAKPRYGKEKKKKTRKQGTQIQRWMLEALRSGREERIALQLRLGLGDACETAVASGAVHALASALFAAAGGGRRCELEVIPDFSRACLVGNMQAVFSWQTGDLLFVWLKRACRGSVQD